MTHRSERAAINRAARESIHRVKGAPESVVITDVGGGLLAVYSRGLTEALRTIPGRQWDYSRGADLVPATERRAVWAAICLVMPVGTPVYGTQGMKPTKAVS